METLDVQDGVMLRIFRFLMRYFAPVVILLLFIANFRGG